MRRLSAISIILLLMLCSLSSWAKDKPYTFSGRVINVHDGDTLSVERGKAVEKIRLFGIDAPELQQPWGDEALKFILF